MVEVLFIDDDSFNKLLAERIFKKLKLSDKVHYVESGDDALSWAKGRDNELPRVILLDINMPGMSGFELLEAFHQQGSNLDKSVIYLMLSTEVQASSKLEKWFGKIKGVIERPLTEDKLKSILT